MRWYIKSLLWLIKMVEVFKTSVIEADEGDCLIELLQSQFPNARINFDLQDCDHILRVEDVQVDALMTQMILLKSGHTCELLED